MKKIKPKETDEARRERMRLIGAKGAAVREANRRRFAAEAAAASHPPADPPPTPRAPTLKGKATVPAALPQLEVWERRLVDPANRGSRDIVLKSKGFTLRWINTEVSGRYQEAVYSQGWIPVRRDELFDQQQIAGLAETSDGLVRTGPSGVYLLCKMPTHVYDAIARRKVEISQGNRRSAQKQRELIMAKAAEHNPRGADAVAALKGEITDLIERVDMDEGDLTPDLPEAADPATINRRELA